MFRDSFLRALVLAMLLSTGALFPISAAAGSLTLSSDKLVVSQGEIFTVTVRGVIEDGDPTLPLGFAHFSYDGDIVLPLGQVGSTSDITSFGGGMAWYHGGVEGSCGGNRIDPHFCYAIDQISHPTNRDVDSATIEAHFAFQAIAPSGNTAAFDFTDFSWFGETSSRRNPDFLESFGYETGVSLPGITIAISPEPTTGALLLFGLAGIALRGRHTR